MPFVRARVNACTDDRTAQFGRHSLSQKARTGSRQASDEDLLQTKKHKGEYAIMRTSVCKHINKQTHTYVQPYTQNRQTDRMTETDRQTGVHAQVC